MAERLACFSSPVTWSRTITIVSLAVPVATVPRYELPSTESLASVVVPRVDVAALNSPENVPFIPFIVFAVKSVAVVVANVVVPVTASVPPFEVLPNVPDVAVIFVK